MTKNEFLNIFNDIDDEFLNELAAVQLRKNRVKEKRSSKEAEAVLKPQYFRSDSSSKFPFKKVMIAAAAVVCVVAVGIFIRVNNKPGTVSSGNTLSGNIYNESIAYDEKDHENPRVDYTKDEVREMLEKYPNLKVSNDYFYASVPKKIDHVSKFYWGAPVQLEPKDALKEFEDVFKYLCPYRDLDKRCLSYLNPIYNDSGDYIDYDFQNVYDNYSFFESGLNGDWYNKSYLFYEESEYPKADSVTIMARSPFGNDLCSFNKGAAQRIAEKTPEGETYVANALLYLSDDLKFVGSYSPDSDERFKLLDKEISIKDAVEFFENYVNNIPSVAPHMYKLHVNTVNVYKSDEDFFCYEFINSRSYDSIHFDYIYDDCNYSNKNRDMSWGVMAKSDDVDYVYATFRAATAFEETRYDKFITFDEAVKIMSEKLTDYVNFEVTRAELMYRYSVNKGSNEFGKLKYPVEPVWKLTMTNPNDGLVYTAYLDALDGKFECHH